MMKNNEWLLPENAPAPTTFEKPINFVKEFRASKLPAWLLTLAGFGLMITPSFFENSPDFLDFAFLAFGFALIFLGISNLREKKRARKIMRKLKINRHDCAAFEKERGEGRLHISEYILTKNWLSERTSLLPLSKVSAIHMSHLTSSDADSDDDYYFVELTFNEKYNVPLECYSQTDMENLTTALEMRCPQAEVSRL